MRLCWMPMQLNKEHIQDQETTVRKFLRLVTEKAETIDPRQ
jgi:hypothetical protein